MDDADKSAGWQYVRCGPRPGDRNPAQWRVAESYAGQLIVAYRGTVKGQPSYFGVPGLPSTQVDGRVVHAQFVTLDEARAYVDATPWRNKGKRRSWAQVQKDEIDGQ